MSNMRIRNMFLLLTAMAVMFLLGCTYKFSTPPFNNDELTKISNSKFGKEIVSILGEFENISQDEETGIDLTAESMVYEISDDFLIEQQYDDEDSSWTISIWTKNNHHIIGCSLMQNEDFEIESFKNSNFETRVNPINPEESGDIFINGQKEELKEIAIKLALTAPKLCYAFPYADASQVPVSTAERIVKEIVEVIKEVTVEKEVPTSDGCMNSRGNLTVQTSAVNLFLLIGPLLLLICYRLYRKYYQ